MAKSIERFNNKQWIHFVDVNHPRELLRGKKTRFDKGRDTMNFTMALRDKCVVLGGKKYEKDLSYFARGIERPGLKDRKVWKFDELKEHLLSKEGVD